MSDASDLDTMTMEMALSHLRTGLKLLTPTEAEAIGKWAAEELKRYVETMDHRETCTYVSIKQFKNRSISSHTTVSE